MMLPYFNTRPNNAATFNRVLSLPFFVYHFTTVHLSNVNLQIREEIQTKLIDSKMVWVSELLR